RGTRGVDARRLIAGVEGAYQRATNRAHPEDQPQRDHSGETQENPGATLHASPYRASRLGWLLHSTQKKAATCHTRVTRRRKGPGRLDSEAERPLHAEG